MKMKQLTAGMIALVMSMSLPMTTYAADWYLEDGAVTVDAGDSGQTVTQDGKSELFQAPADQTDGLTDWVCLGTFYSGADVMLNVSLDVPITMGNDYQDRIGALDWQFMAEEYPISKDDPKAAKTGDDMNIWLYAGIGAVALLAAGLVFATRRKKSE